MQITNDPPPNWTDQKHQHICPVSPCIHFTFHAFGVKWLALNELEDISCIN